MWLNYFLRYFFNKDYVCKNDPHRRVGKGLKSVKIRADVCARADRKAADLRVVLYPQYFLLNNSKVISSVRSRVILKCHGPRGRRKKRRPTGRTVANKLEFLRETSVRCNSPRRVSCMRISISVRLPHRMRTVASDISQQRCKWVNTRSDKPWISKSRSFVAAQISARQRGSALVATVKTGCKVTARRDPCGAL